MKQQLAERHRYFAFLRAINVGGRTVKMDQLRTLFEALRFTDVSTFIASGNVIFHAAETDTRALEERIERHLRKSLGYEVATFIRTTAELAAVAEYVPFPDEPEFPGARLWITFLRDPLSDEASRGLLTLRSHMDDFHSHGREYYWLRRGKFMESLATGPKLEKVIKVPGTARNQNTIRRLLAKFGTPL